ncbi:Protein tyrosine phosphatase type IVA 1 [Harpegnathos saltator]|uniref:Protein tyrosine phosphatase type IVA 1 n=1 Tax=Harpegnathos saltator TaxID=610380 RepID=E2BWD7_HARSA|nr:Protein tyrosine phosphatase type IVA 1 [Harpegnathos saltator]
MRVKDIRPAPAEIEYKNMKFLITDRPNDQTIHTFIQELKKHNVKEVVRVCEPTYKVEELKSEGINVIDLVFDDVHCVAGLGRAPVLVAVALIELGLKFEDAVALIRE